LDYFIEDDLAEASEYENDEETFGLLFFDEK
jgi:hypothetical protein